MYGCEWRCSRRLLHAVPGVSAMDVNIYNTVVTQNAADTLAQQSIATIQRALLQYAGLQVFKMGIM